MDQTWRGNAQRWILDALLKQGGWDVLHPGVQTFFEEFGYYHADIERIFSRVQAASQIPKAWLLTAAEVNRRAEYYLNRGHRRAAYGLFKRAMLLYGRGQYAFFGDDPRKTAYHGEAMRCFEQVAALAPHVVERAAVPLGDMQVHCLFEAPLAARQLPCVVLLPGMDMFKEDFHELVERWIIPRGWAACAIDGPGQGETLLHGGKVTIDNYEQAVSKVIDWLVRRPEVDAERIVLAGISMGAYWGTRVAATEQRLKAVATLQGCHGPKFIIFNAAQPKFKENFMYMAGISDEAEFDRFAERLILSKSILRSIQMPYLLIVGEFDELTTLADTLAVYEQIPAPKEIRVYEWEFHPMGPPAREWQTAALDWLEQALVSGFAPDYDHRLVINRDGTFNEGSAIPSWWQPTRTPAEGV